MEPNLGKFILSVMDQYSDKSFRGTLGEVLYTEAQRAVKDIHTERELTEEEKKIRVLCHCEKTNDLGYLDYDSWILLPKVIRDGITAALDPLLLSGCAFQYSKFLEFETSIFQFLPPELRIVLLHEGLCRYRFIGIDMNARIFNEKDVNTHIKELISRYQIKTYQNINGTTTIQECAGWAVAKRTKDDSKKR